VLEVSLPLDFSREQARDHLGAPAVADDFRFNSQRYNRTNVATLHGACDQRHANSTFAISGFQLHSLGILGASLQIGMKN